MIKASYYINLNDEDVECTLCPHHCHIRPGKTGICRVRKNIDGTLYSLNYGVVSAAALDPIEKKPLYHYMSGNNIFSIGSLGCNLRCSFCQNWQIALAEQPSFDIAEKDVEPMKVVETAVSLIPNSNIGIAYTYNEPTVWFEFMRDIATEAKENSLINVMVSNGFIEEAPLEELLGLIDAFNIDLKGYDQEFYASMTKSSIDPVLRSIRMISLYHKHLEVAYLVIPGKNDDPEKFREKMAWLKDNTNDDIAIHINRYFPCYKLNIEPTPVDTLGKLAEIASKYISRVHVGNV